MILVTGASGFIGSRLVKLARSEGHEVVEMSRRGASGPPWTLGDRLPLDAFADIHFAVHLAHDFGGADGAARTKDGTLAAVSELRKAGVARQIFFSSLSARPDATSLYGKTKYFIEQQLAGAADVAIVRPGLVIGDQGIYGRIRNWVRNWSIAPLPDGGRGRIQVIDVEKLCHLTLAILMSRSDLREFNLFEAESLSLRELVDAMAREEGKRVLIVPVPSRPLLMLLGLCQSLKINLPVTADNLEGFLANQQSMFSPTSFDFQQHPSRSAR